MKRLLWLTRKQFLASLLALAGNALLSKAGSKNKTAAIFRHGVASGDPLQDRVIIWTRITVDDKGETDVYWELAADNRFAEVVQRGAFRTSPDRDHTVKVDVANLRPGTRYHYRFRHRDEYSPVGTTQTLPAALNGGAFHVAVVSCSNWEAGYFAAYRHLAQKPEVDLVLHLGDYIYEYEAGRYSNGITDRLHEPRHEIVTLEDYRKRYAQYHTDPDLQSLHAVKPFCVVWDDHEFANNAYMDGAQNHQPDTEGPWELRKQAAIQAYFEWLPIRGNSPKDLIRKLTIGQDIELYLLDQRVSGKTAQVSLNEPGFHDKGRRLLGEVQYQWLASNLSNSRARWKLIGNQVPFAGYRPNADSLPSYRDKWLGYPQEHGGLMQLLEKENIKNTVFLTGDHHKSFVLAVHREKQPMQYTKPHTERPLAWELLTPSITSKNEDFRPEEEIAAMEAAIYRKDVNPHLLFADIKNHGYYIACVDAHSFKADYYFVDDLYNRQSGERNVMSFTMRGDDFIMKPIGA